jgi:hypothetical protein
MKDDIVFELKAELKKMTKGNLISMVLNQRERRCVVGGVCPFLLEYRCILFCVSEVLRQGCQVERQKVVSVQEDQSESESSQRPKELFIGTSQLLIFGKGSGFSQE